MVKRGEITYSIHPGFEMQAKMIAGMKEKTGRTLDEWAKLIKKSGYKDSKAAAQQLKKNHGLGTLYAQLIAAGRLRKAYERDSAPKRSGCC